jgi:glycosyltransferase involved in cell wall biosynthesis/phosphoheptose isomerase
MRVALVSEHASPLAALGDVDAGGQNVHVAALAETLARLGAEVTVYTRRDDPGLPARVEMAPGVVVCHVDAGAPAPIAKDELLPYMATFGRRLRRAWAVSRPDIVHTHFWMSAHAAMPAAHALDIPLVHTFHALGNVKRRYHGDDDPSPPERLGIEREIIRGADHIICTCTDELFELLRLDADRDRLSIIPCGVDLARFTPDGTRERRRRGRRRIACVTRLVQRKGVGNVIEALAQLDGAELVVAGGPDREQLMHDPGAQRLLKLAEEAGTSDRLDLRGRVGRDELPALLRSADAVVCAPWYEPFGIVALEAMACGVPVVASAVGGLVDTVVHDVTGVHVPPRDPDRLADALRSLLADAERRRHYGAAGVDRVRRLYDWERVGALTYDAYRRIAGRHVAARAASPADRIHLQALRAGLDVLDREAARLETWGERLAEVLTHGGKLLTVGNGGSAAEAQHFSAELVGRFLDERRPLSALCLHGDTSALTAIANDYGSEACFARQVEAHGRPGDVLVALSTSGCSRNVVAAAQAARAAGVQAWAMTGPAPNPLAAACDDALCLPCESRATVQELHLVAVHLVCAAIDRAIARDAGLQRVREAQA